MKNIITTFFIIVACFSFGVLDCLAEGKSRALWASNTSNGVFVSWRMRSTDAPKTTTYKLYADGKLVSEMKDKTNVSLSSQYQNSTFSLEVYDNLGNKIDEQSGVKSTQNDYYPIRLDHPGEYTLNGERLAYFPYDCSAYDMDGDGEQEIIMTWAAGIGATCTPTAPPIIDCIKLDGTRLWRINLGPNVLGGCRFSFLCYDFDEDGYGELIVKTAQGAKDATGNYLSKGAAQGANHNQSSINSSGVITDGGKEWITCFDGRTGKELATIDYWPYFNIQRDWCTESGKTDGNTYGHRGNWFKSCVAFLNVNGKAKPCFVTTRGIYTYSYAAAYSWDGNTLSNLWRNTSERDGNNSIYGAGAHSITCGDVDNDGFDEVIVGAACLDHDGSVLWNTGYGHGDATHLGEFDPSNEGLEYFMITEEPAAKYNGVLLDAKTGRSLAGRPQTGGDTGRGLILDCDSQYDGAEYFDWSDEQMYSCKDVPISAWHVGSTTSSSINFRIFFDGDLYEEYTDRGHVDKWNSQSKTWERLYVYGYNITIDGTKIQWGANTNNDTKYNCCLQADIIGDWREESLFWTTVNGKYYMTIYPTTIPSDYKLPWLRDDHVYDMAVAWQNCGYNQPPHLGYSPVEYYKKLDNQSPATIGRWGSGGARNQTVNVGSPMTATVYNFTNAESVKVIGTLPPGVTATVQNGQIRIEGTPTESGVYQYSLITVGAYDGNEVTDTGGTITVPYGASSLSKENTTNASQEVCQDSAIVDIYFSWDNAQTVEVTGLPNGLIVEVDDNAKKVHIYGTINDEVGEYPYTVQTVGGNPNASIEEKITVKKSEYTDVSDVDFVNLNVTISPNPLIWHSTLSVIVNVPCTVRYSLVDLLGQEVLQASYSAEVGENTYTLHRSDLKCGVYMLQVMVGNELRCLRLIVQ